MGDAPVGAGGGVDPVPDPSRRTSAATFVGVDGDRFVGHDSLVAALRRRWSGRYEVDELGGDPHLQDVLLAPVLARVPLHLHGGHRIPASGPALLVANRGPGLAEPFVLSAAVQRAVGRRLRLVGLPEPPLVGTLSRKLGGVGRRGGDVAAVLRAGHLVAAPLATVVRPDRAGEAPRGVLAATLGFPVVPVALRRGGPLGLGLGPWEVRVGEPLRPPAGTGPGDPLAAAELAEQVRAAIGTLLGTPATPDGGPGGASERPTDGAARGLGLVPVRGR